MSIKGTLLMDFFEFYSNFDFDNDGISLFSKERIEKPILNVPSSSVCAEDGVEEGDGGGVVGAVGVDVVGGDVGTVGGGVGGDVGEGNKLINHADATSIKRNQLVSSMYIENPVEKQLNVSQNVSDNIVAQFKRTSECALKLLLATPTVTPKQLWGVALICQSNPQTQDQHILSNDDREKLNTDLGNIFENK